MRVWALASCSGLLALAACSTEQASSPTPPADQPGDDAAQVQSRGGLAPVGSSSVAEPESGSKQLLTQGARSRLLATRTTPTISSPEAAGQTLPQSAQLRERLQRLRAQQGSRLTASTPLVTVPLPTSVAQSSVAQSSVAQSSVAQESLNLGTSPRPQAQSPAAVAGVSPTAAPGSVSSAQNGQATAQSAITQASGPSPNPTASVPTNTATGLGAPTAANIARSYPISPARHQGYSARLNQPAPMLTTSVSDAPGAQAVRLHGEAPAQTTAAAPNPTPALAPTAATPAPTAPDSVQASTSPAPTIAQPSPAAPPSGAAAGLAGTPSEPQDTQPEGLGTAQVTTQPQPAIAPPESLPLNQVGPRVSPPRTPLVPSQVSPGASVPTPTAQAPRPNLSSLPGVASPGSTPEGAPPSYPGATQILQRHLGQANPASINPQAQTIKGQPTTYCLSNRALSPDPEATAQDWNGMQPKDDRAESGEPGQVGQQVPVESALAAIHCPGESATDDTATLAAPGSDALDSDVATPDQIPVLRQD